MGDDPTDDLVRELAALRLREAEVVRLLEAARREATRRESRRPAAPIRVDRGSVGVFLSVGDKIIILNPVNKPRNWEEGRHWDGGEARLATITRLEGDKVYFSTDNGVNTWRHRRNVKRLQHRP